jgi:hypothetical protein
MYYEGIRTVNEELRSWAFALAMACGPSHDTDNADNLESGLQET